MFLNIYKYLLLILLYIMSLMLLYDSFDFEDMRDFMNAFKIGSDIVCENKNIMSELTTQGIFNSQEGVMYSSSPFQIRNFNENKNEVELL